VASPQASVIVLAYRTIERARACIEAILAAGAGFPFEIILMLNEVCFEEVDRLGPLPQTRLLRSPINLGFAGGNNYAASLAAGEYLIFVNDDALVEAGWLDALVRTAKMHPEAAAVGSCIVFADGSLQEAGCVIWSDGTTAPLGRGERTISGAYDTVQDVDLCSANGLLVRASSWNQVGGFDEGFYPAYYEDVDLCMALRHRLNQRVLYEPRSRIRHFEAASTNPRFREFLFARNVKRIRAKWLQELKGYPQPVSPSALWRAARRWRESSLRILVIDDRMPDSGLGSGFGRFEDFFARVRERNHAVSFFASADPNGDRTQLQDAGVAVIRGSLEEHLQTEDGMYDVVIISRPHNYERFWGAIRRFQSGASIVYDAEALFHRRLFARAALETDPAVATALHREAVQMLALEKEIAGYCDRIVCISLEEQAILAELGARRVDLQFPLAQKIVFGESGFGQRDGIIFVAGWLAGAESPNVSSLRWFVERVLPLISEKVPDVTVRISGANPPPAILELGSPQVRFTGYIDDLPAFYGSALLAIAPVLYGAGTKIKTIEAIQYGVPIVATAVGAEGLGVRDGFGISIADDPAAFAEKVVQLLRNPEHWDVRRRQMRELIERFREASNGWSEIIAAAVAKGPQDASRRGVG